MSQLSAGVKNDEWSTWLLHDRHGGDSTYERVVRQAINRIRNRVLDGACLQSGMVMIDVGTGDGHIAFGAIDRIGPSLRVICTDISEPLLQHAKDLATQRGISSQCQFLHCRADQLSDVPDQSVDVVTTRAVLAYVGDKSAALHEFFRVLKPGGRISLAEPIMRDNACETIAFRNLIENSPQESRNPFLQLLYRWKATQFPDSVDAMEKNPLTNYSERDLFRFVNMAGFVNTHMELHLDQLQPLITSWNVMLGCSSHPWAPTLRKVMNEQFSEEERDCFERSVRPFFEKNPSPTTERNSYLTAQKPNVAIN